MKYLNREPREGDRVHVEFTGVCKYGPDYVTIDDSGYEMELGVVGTDTNIVRVIAPEPKVGDVVTADMDLPEGTIIEDKFGTIARRFPQAWNRLASYYYSETGALLRAYPDGWRIVRIGGPQ